jgi:WD40 repeat protein
VSCRVVLQDEMIYIWDIMTGDLLQTLKGHTGTVYTTTWNPHQSLLARYLVSDVAACRRSLRSADLCACVSVSVVPQLW